MKLHDIMPYSRGIFTQSLYGKTLGDARDLGIAAVLAKLLVGERYL